ncbi:MAG: sugar phosphate isomerase/epimerase family protein [Flavobacteriaceae bacterium]
MKSNPPKQHLFFPSLIVLLLCFITIPTQAQDDIGIQLYSLRHQLNKNPDKALQLVHDWGLVNIEGGDHYGLAEQEFRTLLEKHQLMPVSIGASYEQLRDNPQAVLAKAKRYGVKFVMCAWIPHPSNTFDLAITQAAVETFNKAGALFKKEGITLAYHAHGYEFRPHENGTLFDYMAQHATDFKFEMDVFWVQHGGEDPLRLMNKYPDFVVLLHLKDMAHGVKGNNTGSEDVETNVVLGKGQVDIAGVVKRARALGVRYMFIEDESSQVVNQVPQSLAFLKSLE